MSLKKKSMNNFWNALRKSTNLCWVVFKDIVACMQPMGHRLNIDKLVPNIIFIGESNISCYGKWIPKPCYCNLITVYFLVISNLTQLFLDDGRISMCSERPTLHAPCGLCSILCTQLLVRGKNLRIASERFPWIGSRNDSQKPLVKSQSNGSVQLQMRLGNTVYFCAQEEEKMKIGKCLVIYATGIEKTCAVSAWIDFVPQKHST